MEASTLSEAQYHQNIFEMIGRNLSQQGYTKEQLHQYNLDRDNGLSEADAMKRLHRTNAA
jgi:hypothetical protein